MSFLENSGEQVFSLDKVDGNVFDQLNTVPWSEISFIYHQGAITDTTETDITEIYRHNIRFTLTLMEMAIKFQIPIHYASSASVYGNNIKDGSYGYNPLNYYALSKLTIDYWVLENIKRFKYIVGFRYYNVYGNDERKNDFSTSPVYKFSEQAKTGFIKVFEGSQNMYRDFVCVEDVIKIITERYQNNIYDLGTSVPISFLDVAQLISKKYDAGIKFIPMPEILKNKYQYYTKARRHIVHTYKSLEDWLKEN